MAPWSWSSTTCSESNIENAFSCSKEGSERDIFVFVLQFCSLVLMHKWLQYRKWHWPVMVRRERIREGQRFEHLSLWKLSTKYIMYSAGPCLYEFQWNYYSPPIGFHLLWAFRKEGGGWMTEKKQAACALHAYSVHVCRVWNMTE